MIYKEKYHPNHYSIKVLQHHRWQEPFENDMILWSLQFDCSRTEGNGSVLSELSMMADLGHCDLGEFTIWDVNKSIPPLNPNMSNCRTTVQGLGNLPWFVHTLGTLASTTWVSVGESILKGWMLAPGNAWLMKWKYLFFNSAWKKHRLFFGTKRNWPNLTNRGGLKIMFVNSCPSPSSEDIRF